MRSFNTFSEALSRGRLVIGGRMTTSHRFPPRAVIGSLAGRRREVTPARASGR